MSQSTESTTESNPFTKPGFIIAAALVVALIAAAVVIFLLPKGQDTAQPAPGTTASVTPGHSQPQRHGRCRQERLRTALKHRKQPWEQHQTPGGSLSATMAAPTDPKTFGPGTTDDRTDFARASHIRPPERSTQRRTFWRWAPPGTPPLTGRQQTSS